MQNETLEAARPQPLQGLFDLTGQVALITGGSRGLGLQIAEALGEFGATLILASRKENELQAASERLGSLGYACDTVRADLSKPGEPERLAAEALAKHGRIDILVNNSGTSRGAAAENHSLEDWGKVFDLNVNGLFALTQAVARTAMIPARRGKILNLASIEGLGGHHPQRMGTIAYNASKGAVVNMTRALAAEWGPYNINVNALAPGFFPSKLTDFVIENFGDELRAGTPLGRLGSNQDLKGPALLLTSEAGRHITGHILVIDGGATAI